LAIKLNKNKVKEVELELEETIILG